MQQVHNINSYEKWVNENEFNYKQESEFITKALEKIGFKEVVKKESRYNHYNENIDYEKELTDPTIKYLFEFNVKNRQYDTTNTEVIDSKIEKWSNELEKLIGYRIDRFYTNCFMFMKKSALERISIVIKRR